MLQNRRHAHTHRIWPMILVCVCVLKLNLFFNFFFISTWREKKINLCKSICSFHFVSFFLQLLACSLKKTNKHGKTFNLSINQSIDQFVGNTHTHKIFENFVIFQFYKLPTTQKKLEKNIKHWMTDLQ